MARFSRNGRNTDAPRSYQGKWGERGEWSELVTRVQGTWGRVWLGVERPSAAARLLLLALALFLLCCWTRVAARTVHPAHTTHSMATSPVATLPCPSKGWAKGCTRGAWQRSRRGPNKKAPPRGLRAITVTRCCRSERLGWSGRSKRALAYLADTSSTWG